MTVTNYRQNTLHNTRSKTGVPGNRLDRVARRLTSQLLEGARCALDAHVSCRDWLLYVLGAHGTATAEPAEYRYPQSTTCRDRVGDALAQGIEVAGESDRVGAAVSSCELSRRSGWRWCRPGPRAGLGRGPRRTGSELRSKSVLCSEMSGGVSQRRAGLPVPADAVTALAGELARLCGFPTAAPAVSHSHTSRPCDPAHVLARPASATGGLEGP